MSAGNVDVRPVGIVNATTDSSAGSLYMVMKIGSDDVCCLIDSGSTLSVCHPSVYRNIPGENRPELLSHGGQIRVADGGLVDVEGQVELELTVDTGRNFRMDFVVADVEAPMVLGLDFLREYNGVLDVCAKSLTLNGYTCQCKSDDELPTVFRVTVAETVTVPPNSEMLLPGKLSVKPQFATGVFEVNPKMLEKKPIFLAKMVAHTNTGIVPLRVMNPTDEPQVIYKGQCAASCEAVGSIQGDFEGDVTTENEAAEDMEELPEYLQPLLDSCRENLTPEQILRVQRTLCKYKDAFAKSKDDLGRTDIVQHKINTGDAAPVKQAPRRLPLAKRAAAKEEIQRMQRQGIIEPSTSPWSSQIVMVKKKDPGQWRFCLDYRLVNSLTIKDSYPLPRIDDSLNALRDSTWYTVADLQSGFFQCAIDPIDREKTAFSLPGEGLWQFRVLPMGMANSPATFERLMERVMAGLDHSILLIYLDDLIIHGKTFSDHMDHLEAVLLRLIKAGLKISPKKCQLLQLMVKFLGHIVSGNGLSPCPDKISAVMDWPCPRTVTQIRSFLGLCSYYRKFVKGFAEIARPLHKLTEKGVPFVWSEECEASWVRLKTALTSAPILAYPKEEDDFILDTDASGHSLGAVLSQVQGSQERVIAYYSRSFSKAQRNMCVTRRELFAIVDSVKHFHHFLYGRPVVVRTDHGALRWLLSFKNPEGQMARWLETLGTYDLQIVHRAGKSHQNADALSRRPCGDCKHCLQKELTERLAVESDPPLCAAIKHNTNQSPEPWLAAWSDGDIQKWQDDDPCIKKVIVWLKSGDRPKWSVMRSEGANMRVYWTMWNQLILKNDKLYRSDSSDKRRGVLRLVAPIKIREDILHSLHNNKTAAHLGITKTLEKVKSRFWWPGLKKDVHRWCQYCPTCQKRNLRVGRRKATLQQDPVGSPMERIGIDIVSFREKTDDGNTCVLVVVDYFTKWTEAFALPDHTALTVADILVTEVFTRLGVPRLLHSDQGGEFQSKLMTELYNLLEIKKTRTTPFHPSSDGLVENFNRTLINMLSKFCQENKSNWDHHLPYLLCAYRSSIQESTGCTPNMMMLGRETSLPVDIMYSVSKEVGPPCPVTYVEWVRQAMEENFERVRDNLKVAATRQKRYFDERAEMRSFKPGDWVVRYYLPNVIKSKLNSPYVGPYLVTKKLGEVTYELQKDLSSSPIKIHVDDLKAYNEQSDRLNWVLQNPNTGNMLQADDPVFNSPPSIDAADASSSDNLLQPLAEITPICEERSVNDCVPVPENLPRRSARQRIKSSRFKDFVL